MNVDYLSDTFYEQVFTELKTRVDESRFAHSVSVAKMTVELAEIYHVDVAKARLAGILHDWDKGFSNEEIIQRAHEFSIVVPDLVYEQMPRVLHAQTAAYALAQIYPGMPVDILQAIERHTSAAIGMSALDMVVYSADALEPLRTLDELDEIRAMIGKVSLESLFFTTFADIFVSLIKKKKMVNPITVEVWNYYTLRERERTMKGNM